MNLRPTPAGDASRRAQVLAAYRISRIEEQIAYYEARAAQYERARRTAVNLAAGLLVLAALFGALATADADRRSMWAFLAAVVAAAATAIASYEAAFGFERLSREYGSTRAALEMAEVRAPRGATIASDDGDALVMRHISEVEGLLLSEVDRWSHATDGTKPGPADDQ
jgi:hypothetical protein